MYCPVLLLSGIHASQLFEHATQELLVANTYPILHYIHYEILPALQ